MSAPKVRVYWSRVPSDSATTQRYLEALPGDERQQAVHAPHASQQQQLVASRTLLRQVLSHRHRQDDGETHPPEYWRFHRENGRLCTDRDQTRWHISLSHTGELVALILAESPRCGVDLELANRELPCLEIARRYFHADEYAALAALPADQQRDLFLTLWTHKEASVKAWHTGLAHHMASIHFDPASLQMTGSPAEFQAYPLQLQHWKNAGMFICAAVHMPEPVQWRLREWLLE